MKKIIILLFIVFSILSCKNDTEEIIQYDKEGNILSKNYISNGKSLDSTIYLKNELVITKIIFNKDNKSECYVKYYDNNGKLESEGNTINKIKIGKWKFYGSKTKEAKIVEFENICGEEYPNQEWNYDDKGKLNLDIRSYYTYKFKSPVFKSGGTNILTINYTPMIKKGAICIINFSNKIDSTFCNVDKIEKVAFRSSDSLTFTVPMMLDEIGKHNFRGYIEEHVFEEVKNSNLSNHKIRRVYINIPFEVK